MKIVKNNWTEIMFTRKKLLFTCCERLTANVQLSLYTVHCPASQCEISETISILSSGRRTLSTTQPVKWICFVISEKHESHFLSDFSLGEARNV